MTSGIIPTAFLFRYTVRCSYIAPRRNGSLKRKRSQRSELPLELGPNYRIPDLGEIDGLSAFAELYLAWGDHGISVSLDVRGKTQPPRCDASHPETSDGLDLWLDTRDTRTIHRASRFCHHFYFLPAGGGRSGGGPIAGQCKIHRAREDAPLSDPADVLVRSCVRKGGYGLDALLPVPVLTGFDPAENPRLGFYYRVRDAELGEQTLTAARGFPFAEDPSLWATLELTSPKAGMPQI